MNNNNEQFFFREPFVLLTIICISSLTQTPTENVGFHNNPDQELKLWICHIVIPVPGIILVAVLSNIFGRKFAFKLLCGLTTMSSFFKSFPWLINGVKEIQSIITGGVLATTFLAISEYCTPKHRLAYLIANTVVRETVGQSTSYIVGHWLPVFEVGMALMCLGSVFMWPEAPYWLVVKGRREEVRSALLWLRKEGASARSELQYLERMPGPLPRSMPFWETLLPFVAVCVSQLSYYHQYVVTRVINHKMPSYISVIQKITIIVVLGIIIYCSYKPKRNVIYFILTLISIASYYLIGFWLLFYQHEHKKVSTVVTLVLCFSNILLFCGIYVIMNAIFIEFVPIEYNTEISCICAFIFKISPLILWYIYPTDNLESISLNSFFVMPLSLCTLIVYKFSPVTYNKNLLEIQEASARARRITRRDAPGQNPSSIELTLQYLQPVHSASEVRVGDPVTVNRDIHRQSN